MAGLVVILMIIITGLIMRIWCLKQDVKYCKKKDKVFVSPKELGEDTMKAYKIVRVRNGRFYSYVQNDKYEVQYYTDYYTTPNYKDMPLFCCPNLDSVRYILNDSESTDIKVFECDVVKHSGELHEWCDWAKDSANIILASKVLLLKEVVL